MATNEPVGDNARKGAVRNRSQFFNRLIERFIKRDKKTGRFMNVKADERRFKGVVRED